MVSAFRLVTGASPFGNLFFIPRAIEAADYLDNGDRVQRCQLLGLQDLKTESPVVQANIAAYLNGRILTGSVRWGTIGAERCR
ncbi:hypothetical protein [Prochlorothrix hollandica]|uniref:hypothetical protein n=1 Tax=Prochlorothrix hollandica TaxID=1223 RepID=UPI001CED317A|nr:hypothetical protein [Prochlorothrix hollandica]